ncbi:MAG TPA: gamma-glutamyl-gamma-aminobutyrate hydrolase family protein [Trebonia sp.]|nr:gamma-glutamyl-gamma-aminobutyrate hydrolase family protein [Trebonia sp.]
MKRALFIQHDHYSPSGLVGDAFATLGYDITEVRVVPRERYRSPDVTVTFPDATAYDALVAFGAVWSVYDDAAIGSWVGDEIELTRTAIAAGVPVLGICFGGQMLATAVGGRVERAPSPEIGWTPITRTSSSPVLPPGPWFEWHYDRFLLPQGVPSLATTDLGGGEIASQAFTVGRSLGLQFHPEVTEAVLGAWLYEGGSEELATIGVDPTRMISETRAVADDAATRAHELVRRFVTDVATRPVVARHDRVDRGCDKGHIYR